MFKGAELIADDMKQHTDNDLKRFSLLCCDIFLREACLIISRAPYSTDVKFIPKGLHVNPKKMRNSLQEEIDNSDDEGYDAILLGFGLCGNVAEGLKARKTPLVIPRVHDCIAIFYGSNSRYIEEFSTNPGTYHYTSGSFERKRLNDSNHGALGVDLDPDHEKRFEEYKAKYGEENAEYLIAVEKGWSKNYTRVVYFDLPEMKFLNYEERTKGIAERKGLEFVIKDADMSILQRLLSGEWNDDFLIVRPGQSIISTHDARVIDAIN